MNRDYPRRDASGDARPAASRRKLKLCELWERQSAKGNAYLSGFWGDLSLIAFCEERPHPKRPDEAIRVWSIFAEERDQNRRPGGGGGAPR
jgi:hypothetical protein